MFVHLGYGKESPSPYVLFFFFFFFKMSFSRVCNGLRKVKSIWWGYVLEVILFCFSKGVAGMNLGMV